MDSGRPAHPKSRKSGRYSILIVEGNCEVSLESMVSLCGPHLQETMFQKLKQTVAPHCAPSCRSVVPQFSLYVATLYSVDVVPFFRIIIQSVFSRSGKLGKKRYLHNCLLGFRLLLCLTTAKWI